MRTAKGLALLLTLAAGSPAACGQGADEQGAAQPGTLVVRAGSSPGYQDITATELASMMRDMELFLVNVHVPFVGNIPGTDATIPYHQLELKLEWLPADADAKIVLYCRSGNMSRTAAASLAAAGYRKVYNVTGGMQAWTAAGLPLEGRAGGSP